MTIAYKTNTKQRVAPGATAMIITGTVPNTNAFVSGDDGSQFYCRVDEPNTLRSAKFLGQYNYQDHSVTVVQILTSSTGRLEFPIWGSNSLVLTTLEYTDVYPNTIPWQVKPLSAVAGHIVTNASDSTDFTFTFDDDYTLDKPTGVRDGQVLCFKFTQGGGNLITLDASFVFGTSIDAFALTATAAAVDYMWAKYDADADVFRVIDVKKGY